MPQNAASELDQHCLRMFLNWVYVLKNVDDTKISINETKLAYYLDLCFEMKVTTKQQTTKFPSANFQKILSPSYNILRIQRQEGKQCRSS